MSEYRDTARSVHSEARWTFWKFIPLFLGAVAILFVVFFWLRSIGLIGSTVVEREVFERSYQRSEALKARIATDEAVLTEIKRKLSNVNLDVNTRHNLEAQASAARVRISTTQGIQK